MSESTITKKALADGLKAMMRTKPFDKISVADITKSCGLNRQTFYYHFQDKFDLVNWIYYNELIMRVAEGLSYENWNTRIAEILEFMREDRSFYQTTLRQSGNNGFQEYLFRVVRELLVDIIRRMAGELPVETVNLNFLAEFFTYGIVGMIVQWAQKGMIESPQELSKSLKKLVNEIKQLAAERYFQQNAEGDAISIT